MDEIIDRFGVLYGISANTDGSNWIEFGDNASAKHTQLVNEYLPPAEGIPELNEMLLESASLPQVVGQGSVKCILFKPSSTVVVGIVLNFEGDSTSFFLLCDEIESALARLY